MTTTEIRLPENFEELKDSAMSNFDHEVDVVVAEDLKTKEAWSPYPGWNFFGKVWWDREAEIYHCEVWTYGCYSETFSGSLEEIMQNVSLRYGSK